ncbi:DNA internalization-related competence protein ComEC/Rec2 [Vibrio bivalvicida]|uniref:DNA internalization-related competence protein ComEC/Rec2 n=1 Tax=Vibrio bivalvicida TaxID=1276888 RepID=A0ABV4MH02_9VIBR
MTLYLYYWTLISFSLLITTSPYWPLLPNIEHLLIALAILVVSTKYRKARGFLGLALAYVVILMHGNVLRYQTETLFQAGQDITIIADVDSLFKPINFGFQGIVVVRSINGEALTKINQPKIRLSSPVLLKLGERISARVRVKPIYGLMNSTGFDAEQYALTQGITGSGTMDRKRSFFIVSQHSVRAQLIDSVRDKTHQLEHQAMVLALMFGVREGISAQSWLKLKQSGLSHLVAISGLHVGIAFGIGWLLGFTLLRVHSLFLHAPMLVGLVVAFSYAWLAGFSIPTQRAVIMCFLVCVFTQLSGRVPNSLKWLLVLCALLTLAPFSVVSPSLWMSMSAVGIIFLYQTKSKSRATLFGQTIEAQLYLVVVMMPLVIYLFHGLSFGAVVYNLIFVPWFTLVVIPLVFLSFTCQLLAPWIELPWWVLEYSLKPVNWAMEYSHWTWFDMSNQSLLWLVTSTAVITMCRMVAKQYVCLIAYCVSLSLITWREPPLWRITVLDVGHGLSVIVQQDDRAFIYDTGAAWPTSSIAEQIITPTMIARGISDLDYLVISHFDNDHAGGVEALKERWAPKVTLTSQTGYSLTPCIKGRSWQWDGITIEALWPPTTAARAYNPHSCVFKLVHKDSPTTLLLAGDIEAIAEWILVRDGQKLDSDILIVPHHGSKTSSVPAFVKAVNPEVAVASLAKGGRWQLPDENVVTNYQKAGAKWMDTGQYGQIVFDIYPRRYQVTALRESKGKTWYRQMLRNGVE